ncbi:response regulator [Reichenbachiella sp. MALMAid0571]|uniref:response regulator n=1 Tax=Reichenbachiella sp. MALMAid0571 TaxID=3143939 RepID=UPI0032DED40A
MKRKLSCVLLIDDDEATNFINQMALDEVNCTENIKICQTAMDALIFLKGESNKPDLILLDINTPGINGWEFLEEYSKLPSSQQAEIVLVMLTTSLNPADRERAELIPEISGFKSKPLSSELINEILHEHFPNRF